MRPIFEELKDEFHRLDMMAINGQQMSAKLVRRWAKLFKLYFKPKIADYQLSTREIRLYKKLMSIKHLGPKSGIKGGFLGG